MTVRINIPSPRTHATLLILLAFLSCDSYNGDHIEPEKQVVFTKTEYYVVPGSSVVIDLESVVEKSFTNASLKISQNPLRGTLSQLGSLLLKYYPARDFLDGADQFVFSVLSNNEVIATETITIYVKQDVGELPCALYAVEDKVYVRSGSMVSVNFLKNDGLCGVTSPLQVSIHSNSKFGDSQVVGDSIIVYRAGPGYTGRDEVVYKLSDSSGDNVSYGIINISEWKVQFFPTPITPLRSQLGSMVTDVAKMFFVNNTTGYLGGYGIYKTTDGGATWKVSYPATDDRQFAITDIYFLDADHGYASYSGIGLWSSCGCERAGLIRTVDGGDTWEDAFEGESHVSINSIFFTSSTTGFVGISSGSFDDANPFPAIRKTDDGGITWKWVLTYSDFDYDIFNILYADSKVGYAHGNSTIYRTIDGGESWQSVYENGYIKSAAVLPENIVSANFTVGGSLINAEFNVFPFGSLSEITPSTMVWSREGEAWSPTINLPYTIFAQGFSPGGTIGFALGISAINPSFNYPDEDQFRRSQTLSIIKSVDKGATWTTFETAEPLYGYPWAISVPSDTVAYVLGFRELIKFTRP